MSGYRQHLYHIVFRTKDSLRPIRQDHVNELYSYITGFIKHKNSHLYRINGVGNHLHILTDTNPALAPVDFVKDIKVATSIWVKHNNLFPAFKGWAASSFRAAGGMLQSDPWFRQGLFIIGSFRAYNKISEIVNGPLNPLIKKGRSSTALNVRSQEMNQKRTPKNPT